jgi:hypothetical protein
MRSAALEQLVWVLLLAAPPATLALYLVMGRLFPPSLKAAAWVAGAILLMVAGAWLTRIRFVSIPANIWALAIAYGAYAFLAISLIRLPWSRWVRIVSVVLAALPIAYGYFVGTVGVLVLWIVANDYVQRPLETVQIAPGIICTKTSWGGFDMGGYRLHIYQRWSATPFVWREIRTMPVDPINAHSGPMACGDLKPTRS